MIKYEKEPNSFLSQAQRIYNGETVIGSFSRKRDYDWYFISFKKSGRTTVTVEPLDPNDRPHIEIIVKKRISSHGTTTLEKISGYGKQSLELKECKRNRDYYIELTHKYGVDCKYILKVTNHSDTTGTGEASPIVSRINEIGTQAYLQDIRTIQRVENSKMALFQMMADFNSFDKGSRESFKKSCSNQFDNQFDAFCEKFNELVKSWDITERVLVGYGPGNVPRYEEKIIDEFESIHYFRNKLNKAPMKLADLLADKDKWEILPREKAAFHMNGKDGIFNLKFVSKGDQRFEAVYDKNEILLTEENDPVNMGTYNFTGPNDFSKHKLYDVETYYKWGNTEKLEGKGSTYELANAAANITLFNDNTEAFYRHIRYSRIMEQ